jgi:hypothetical protein
VPGSKAYKPPVSRSQARFFGLAAGGGVPGFSPTEARNKLKGVSQKRLPERVKNGRPRR